ncbi:MAG: S1 RNA-binding domain-containing protein [Proteobacteria bacterium]|nr:S1 RNA-binding domain-containing protein [Pseudomonadota bacterium]
MSEQASHSEIRDQVGQIVTAQIEDISENRVIARFDNTERTFVSRDECASDIKVGDKIEVFIEGIAKNGTWSGSIAKIPLMRLWNRIDEARKKETNLEAIVIASEDKGLICDVESLMAFMPYREIEESPLPQLDDYIGRKFEVRVLKFSGADGRLIVSHRAAIAEQLLKNREDFLANLKPDQIYDGTVRQIVDFGVFVDIGYGVEGLVHRSNLTWGKEDPACLFAIGDKIKVIVLSVETGRIALGHKQLIKDNWADVVQTLHVGDIVDGKVTTFANFGVFVRIADQVEGLVHNSELSWDTAVRQAQQILKVNDEVRVRILNIDPEKRRLQLSLRRVESNPWQRVLDEYPAGARLKTKIVGVADFGIFVDLGHDLRGLIHKNDLPKFEDDFANHYAVDDEIECVMLNVDVAKERASLSVKQLAGDPYQNFVAQNPVGKRFEAEIKRIVKFGAFAAIGEVEGLIHISELSENRVENVGSVVKVGQKVEVTVVSLDVKRRRIGLSLIAEPFESVEDAPEDNPVEDESSSRATMADIFPESLKK